MLKMLFYQWADVELQFRWKTRLDKRTKDSRTMFRPLGFIRQKADFFLITLLFIKKKLLN